MVCKSKQVEEIFWGFVHKSKTCWEWTGSLTQNGYGDFRCLNVRIRAHRMSWLITYKEEPKNCILHKCDNRKCVNPSHLFSGSRKDNAQDAVKKGRQSSMIKTHCPKNHKYSLENTYIHKNGSRRCKSCAKEYSKIKEAVVWQE